MPIWKKALTLDELNASFGPHDSADNMQSVFGIRFTAVGEDYLEATMPVTSKVKQPFGLLHGGASCVLAETVGSVASNLVAGDGKECLGIEINANHVRAVREGTVTARVSPVHLGATLHVWEIRINDEARRLVCASRLTVMVRERKAASGAPRA